MSVLAHTPQYICVEEEEEEVEGDKDVLAGEYWNNKLFKEILHVFMINTSFEILYKLSKF